MVKSIPHNRLTFSDAECDAILRTVRTGQWAQGPRVAELEATLAHRTGVKYAICVASGFSALRLALGATGVSAGDSILIPAYSCVALANSVLTWGAVPVAIDVESASWNVDQELCLKAIAKGRPRAAIVVNTFGVPAQLDEIVDAGIPVIEDCAHAFGIQLDGKWLGTRATVGVLSFYATKLIGGGEGGAILTNSHEIADYVRRARDYSDQVPSAFRMNDKMSDLEASLVLAQLERLPEMLSRRQQIAERYLRLLSGNSTQGYILPVRKEPRVWYRFTVEMKASPAESIVSELRTLGIQAALPVSDWRTGELRGDSTADRAYRRIVSLPLYPTLTEDEQDSVVNAFRQVCEERTDAAVRY